MERRLRHGKTEEPWLPWLRLLAAEAGGNESFLRTALALAVFCERGLLALTRQDDMLLASLTPTQGKVDLTACPYLARLSPGGANRNRGDLP